MKKYGILNSNISDVLSRMGHTDTICIADCGLPIPAQTERIDLALTLGVPGFLDVLSAVLADMKVEKIYLAEEIREQNPKIFTAIQTLLPETKTEFVSHAALKRRMEGCRAVIRTGEASPYANILLQAACVF